MVFITGRWSSTTLYSDPGIESGGPQVGEELVY